MHWYVNKKETQYLVMYLTNFLTNKCLLVYIIIYIIIVTVSSWMCFVVKGLVYGMSGILIPC